MRPFLSLSLVTLLVLSTCLSVILPLIVADSSSSSPSPSVSPVSSSASASASAARPVSSSAAGGISGQSAVSASSASQVIASSSSVASSPTSTSASGQPGPGGNASVSSSAASSPASSTGVACAGGGNPGSGNLTQCWSCPISPLCASSSSFPTAAFTFPSSNNAAADGLKCCQLEQIISEEILYYAQAGSCPQTILNAICQLAVQQAGNCTAPPSPVFTQSTCPALTNCLSSVGADFVTQSQVCTDPNSFFNNPNQFYIFNHTTVLPTLTSSTGNAGGGTNSATSAVDQGVTLTTGLVIMAATLALLF